MFSFLAYTVIAIFTPFNVAYPTTRHIFGFYKALIERLCFNLINGPYGVQIKSVIILMISNKSGIIYVINDIIRS